MRPFEVAIEVTYTTFVTVEAEDWTAALEAAEDNYRVGDYDDDIREAIISADFDPDDHDVSVRPF